MPTAVREPQERTASPEPVVWPPTPKTSWRSSAPFLAFHLLPLLALFTGVSRRAVILCVGLYVVRMFFVTAGYHRYFAHRTYRMGRAAQLVFAFGGLTAAQKGPLWWASHHRDHHRYADTPRDPHSPQQGLWWSHIGWILSGRFGATDFDAIDDFARYPELRWLDRHDWVGPWALGFFSWLVAGWSGLVIGFFLSTILLWHATFMVNSVAHLVGRRRYRTADTSRNFLPLALITGGEGWHNNHHHYPMSTRQGFFWWELDMTYLTLRVLAWLGIVDGLRQPPAKALAARRLRAAGTDAEPPAEDLLTRAQMLRND
jgi:stearoyl-CoA desaturase (delta-9 desaturase)